MPVLSVFVYKYRDYSWGSELLRSPASVCLHQNSWGTLFPRERCLLPLLSPMQSALADLLRRGLPRRLTTVSTISPTSRDTPSLLICGRSASPLHVRSGTTLCLRTSGSSQPRWRIFSWFRPRSSSGSSSLRRSSTSSPSSASKLGFPGLRPGAGLCMDGPSRKPFSQFGCPAVLAGSPSRTSPPTCPLLGGSCATPVVAIEPSRLLEMVSSILPFSSPRARSSHILFAWWTALPARPRSSLSIRTSTAATVTDVATLATLVCSVEPLPTFLALRLSGVPWCSPPCWSDPV